MTEATGPTEEEIAAAQATLDAAAEAERAAQAEAEAERMARLEPLHAIVHSDSYSEMSKALRDLLPSTFGEPTIFPHLSALTTIMERLAASVPTPPAPIEPPAEPV